jgi:hypothetical protein
MALTANTLREGLAVAASAAGRRKEDGAPRKEEVSFLAVGEGSSPWRDKVVMAMAASTGKEESATLFCSALSYLLILYGATSWDGN